MRRPNCRRGCCCHSEIAGQELRSLPTPQLKSVADLIAPFICELFNRSLTTATVLDVQVCIHHTAAKETIHGFCRCSVLPTNLQSLAALSVLSKLLERLVHRQMLDYLNRHRLLPRLQSAYRQYHSTETAVLRVLADILHAVDTGDLSILALLDLSAAFDTVDHDILLQRLQTSFGVVSVACDWFRSYLTVRVQCVRRGSSKSATVVLRFGLPQSSVLGPLLFILYTADLITLIEDFGSGDACFPPRWCELLVGRGRSLRDAG